MIATDIISSILIRYKNLCTKYPQSPSFVSNKKGDSFYLIRNRGEEQQPTQIRLSNHGTYLNTWVDREEFGDSVDRLDPAHCVNISIVFINEGEDLTKDCKGMPNCEGCEIEPCKPQTFEGQDELGRPFTIMQYVYSSKCIRNKYINGLAKAIMEASVNGKYIDPLANLYRAAKTKSLNSSTTQRNNNQELNCNTNMNKKLIRLTESDLHKIVKESVNRVLTELDWKTYDSAMRKAAEKGQWERVGAFGDASKKAFNKQFGYEGHPEDYAYGRHLTPYQRDFDSDLEPIDNTTISNQGYYGDSVYLMHPNDKGHVLDREEMFYRRTPKGKIEKDSPIRKDKNDYSDLDWYLANGYEDGADINSAMDAAKKGEEDTLNYLKGKSKYVPSKGWQNESINRKIDRIVNECLKRNFR